MDNKTKTIIVDQTSVATNSKKIEVSAAETQKIFIKTNHEEQQQVPSKKNVNPYASYFPTFYVKELKHSKWVLAGWIITAIILLAGMATAGFLTIEDSKPDTYWLIVIYVLPLLIFFPMFFINVNRYVALKNEAKTINFKDQKTLSSNTVSLYKRLKVAYLNANWFCSLGYILCITAFLGLIIGAWAVGTYKTAAGGASQFHWWDVVNFKDFLQNPLSLILKPVPGEEDWFIAFVVILACLFACIFIHIYTITTSYMRVARIENFYNSFIVTNEEIEAYKKKTNRRDAIIFCICLLIIGLIIWGAIKAAKKKRAALTPVPGV